MDLKTYISSGIIEQYALGTLSQEEASILECVIINNSEVQAAVVLAQQTIEDLGQAQRITPAANLKQKIASQLTFDNSLNLQLDSTVTRNDETAANVKQLHKSENSNLWAIAASLLLLLSLGYSVYTNRTKNDEIDDLIQNQSVLQNQVDYVQQQNDLLLNADKIKLLGVEKHPNLEATVFVDASHRVHLLLDNLPVAPEGKDYQLWAIVDGIPVDMGIYDQSKSEKLQIMKSVQNPQAFAITLENKGGNETPTMDEMYVMGKVS